MFLLMEHADVPVNEKVSAAALLLFDCYHHSNLAAGQRLAALIHRCWRNRASRRRSLASGGSRWVSCR
jgi:hypothetical protein